MNFSPGLMSTSETHLFERNFVERVNAMLLGTLWIALAMCLLAALAYDRAPSALVARNAQAQVLPEPHHSVDGSAGSTRTAPFG